MRKDQQDEFVTLITDVLKFYRQDTTPFTLEVWWQACQRFDLEQVSKALTGHAMDAERGVFAPKPADIVRKLEGTSTDRAMLAWGKAFDAMQRVGAYSDVVFDDPAIHAAIEDLGGWAKVCRSETKDIGYLQHKFCEAHRAYTEHGQFEYPKLLTGDRSPDEMYAKRGLKPPKPAVIGDMDTARLVYKGGSVGGKTAINFQIGALLAMKNESGKSDERRTSGDARSSASMRSSLLVERIPKNDEA